MITSRQNPRIKEWMQLAKHSKNSRVLVEGAHLLAEAIVSRVEIEVVLYVPRRVNDEVQSLVSQVQQRGVEVVEMSEVNNPIYEERKYRLNTKSYERQTHSYFFFL